MQYLALKVPKSAKHYTEAAIELLNCITKERMQCESLEKSISAAPCAVTPHRQGVHVHAQKHKNPRSLKALVIIKMKQL